MMKVTRTFRPPVRIVVLVAALCAHHPNNRHGVVVRADFAISTNQQHVPTSTELSQSACTNDAQCLNGGTCTTTTTSSATSTNNSNSNSYQRVCDCPSGYGGTHCQDHCPLRCQNGGYCQLLDSRDPTQYRSSNLESRYDNSYSYSYSYSSGSGSGAADGTTTSSAAPSYQCKCRGLYSGKLCNVPYQNCPSSRKCYNGGTCVPSSTASSDSFCSCPEGYGGGSCDQRGDGFGASQGLAASSTDPDTGGGRAAGIAVALVILVLVVSIGALVIRSRRRRQRRRNQPYKSVLSKEASTNLRPHPEFWESEGMPIPPTASGASRSSFAANEEVEEERESERERDPLRLVDSSRSCVGIDEFYGDGNDPAASAGMADDRPEAQHRWRNIV